MLAFLSLAAIFRLEKLSLIENCETAISAWMVEGMLSQQQNLNRGSEKTGTSPKLDS